MRTKLSEQAWQKSSKAVSAAIAHPFNQELAQGTLAHSKFSYYLEQDKHFLRDFGKCHAIIASKVRIEYAGIFLKHAENCFLGEKGILNKIPDIVITNQTAPATVSLTSFLLNMATNEPIEVAIAAALPCFWLYREVGLSIANNAKENNPYAAWISNYSNPNFSASVDKMIEIFDNLASATTDEIKARMADAFYTSSALEWHFWNDAYNGTAIDNFNTNSRIDFHVVEQSDLGCARN